MQTQHDHDSPADIATSDSPDGSLTFYIQKNTPRKDKESNWLPAPDGPFYAIYRVYMPGEAVLNGTWKKPPMQAVAAE